MEADLDFLDFLRAAKNLSTENRPLRMRLAFPDGISGDVLLPQRVVGSEAICGGLSYRIDCLATDATLELKRFIALPVELQFVTDQGGLRCVCGIVTEACAGQSDGGLATYQLTMSDAFALMERSCNSRVFRKMHEVEIIELIFKQWQQRDGTLASCFDLDTAQLAQVSQYPRREFIHQHNESDAAFLRRLMKRRGIAWFFRSGPARSRPAVALGDTPMHTLVLFNNADLLDENAAGTVRYHRDDATEARDTVTAWSAIRSLQAGSVSRHSWDYDHPSAASFMTTTARSLVDQGESGNATAASISDYFVSAPHVADDHEDHVRLGQLRLNWLDLRTKSFQAESSVRDAAVGEWFSLIGHPEIDTHPEDEQAFVITELFVVAENNIAQAQGATLRKLLDANDWDSGGAYAQLAAHRKGDDNGIRYRNRFTCVRRGVAIVPAFDARTDLPQMQLESAIVVGPSGEDIHCDELGRVRVSFPGMRVIDHAHADGAGASGTEVDSAWVRVASTWAGPGPGSASQVGALGLPRVGTEVVIAYLGGDPDKPIIIGQVYNRDATPPALHSFGGLPANKYLSGLQSSEGHGKRVNHLRLDDTPGQISAQLSSDHGASELNLGWLSHPRVKGKGEPRGEGAELRSDKAVAVRGAQGLLLSADGRANTPRALLERDEMLGMVDVLRSIAEQLADLAATHAGDAADGPHLARLIDRLKAWEGGSNTEPGAGGGGAPIIVASAAAGMALSSQDNIVLGAADKIDLLCGGDTALSTGRRLLARATEGISLFAMRLGMKLIAATGEIKIEAHDGNITLATPRRIKLSAGEGVDIEAPQVRIVTKGACVDYGEGKVTYQCSGDYTIKSAHFLHTAPGDATPAGVTFPSSKLETDERIVVKCLQTDEPIKGAQITATLENGTVITRTTDESGFTEKIKSTEFGAVQLDIKRPLRGS